MRESKVVWFVDVIKVMTRMATMDSAHFIFWNHHMHKTTEAVIQYDFPQFRAQSCLAFRKPTNGVVNQVPDDTSGNNRLESMIQTQQILGVDKGSHVLWTLERSRV